MNKYICETELAASGVFDLIGQDDLVLGCKRAELKSAMTARQNAQSILYAGAPPSAFGENTTPYFENKVRDARAKIERVKIEITQIELIIAAKEASLQALAGAILQIAKQGIAIVHGGLDNCPPGRPVGRETLSNVIWQGRNQSMHWEENSFNRRVVACFTNLASDFCSDFKLPATVPRSLAMQVVRLLGWTNYDAYKFDMASILR